MGIVIRQSIKSVIVTMAGIVLGASIMLLSTHFFSKEQYGFTQNLIKISTQISYFGLFGFNYALLVYGQKYPPGHRARSTFLAFSAIIPLILSFFITGLYFLFFYSLEKVYVRDTDIRLMKEYFMLFPILTSLTITISWLEGYLQSIHKTALQSFAREILARIVYLTLIALYAFRAIGFSTFIWLYVALYLLPFLFLLYVSRRNQGFHFRYIKNALSFGEMKEILRFSGYHSLTVVTTVLILQLDVLLLGPLSKGGLEDVATYSVATLVVAMLRNPTRIIGTAVMPVFTKEYSNNDLQKLRSLFHRSAINMQIIGLSMFAVVSLNINNIQKLMSIVQDGYGEIKILIIVLMVGQVVDMITGLNTELIGVTKYYRFNFFIAIILLTVVIALNFFLIKAMGINGAAWATTIGLIFYNIAKTIFLWKKLKMNPFNEKSLIVLISAIIAGIIAGGIPYFTNVFLDAIVRTIIYGIVFGLIIYRSKISQDVNDIIDNISRNQRLY